MADYSVKIGSRSGGLAKDLFGYMQQRKKRLDEQEDEFKTFRRRVQEAVLTGQVPGVEATDEFIQSMISGQPLTGTGFQRRELSKIGPKDLLPGQKLSQDIPGVGTLTTEGISSGISDDVFDRANTLRDEYRSSQTFKNWQEIDRAQRNIESAYRISVDPNTQSRLASDQALGVSIQKMLDPGSVVRESEYARTAEGAALINQLYGTVTQVAKGGMRLTDSDRLAIKQMADTILTNSQASLRVERQTYESLADRTQVPRDLIFGDTGGFTGNGSDNGDSQAVQWLQERNAPVTARNIQAVKQRFGWQ